MEKTKAQVKSSATFMLTIGIILAVTCVFLVVKGQATGIALSVIAIISIGLGIKGLRKAEQMPDS
jgi:hypothetical protein